MKILDHPVQEPRFLDDQEFKAYQEMIKNAVFTRLTQRLQLFLLLVLNMDSGCEPEIDHQFCGCCKPEVHHPVCSKLEALSLYHAWHALLAMAHQEEKLLDQFLIRLKFLSSKIFLIEGSRNVQELKFLDR